MSFEYLAANVRHSATSFDAHLVENNFFEGWYFKIVRKDGVNCFFIPGIYHSPLAKSHSHAFIMFWVSGMSSANYYRYRTDAYSFDTQKTIKVGTSKFSLAGAYLDLRAADLWIPTPQELDEYKSLTPYPTIPQQNLDYSANFTFTNITEFPSRMFESGVMGAFGFIPFLSCYHGIASLHHEVTGYVESDAKTIEFKTNTTGYIEKDWGREFPNIGYIWIQSHTFDSEDTTFLLSLASVPVPLKMGSTPGFLVILKIGKIIYNFSTYAFAKFVYVYVDTIAGGLSVSFQLRKKGLRLTGTCCTTKFSTSVHLRAPMNGQMKTHVEEWNGAEVKLKLEETSRGNHVVIFEGIGTNAGLEAIGDIQWLKNRI